MTGFSQKRLLWPLAVLAVLVTSLTVVSRSRIDTTLESMSRGSLPSASLQPQSPLVTAQAQPGAPLVISSPRIITWDGHELETAIDLINISNKPIRAYAIKQFFRGQEDESGKVMFVSLDLTNSPELLPNDLTTTFDVAQTGSDKKLNVMFLIDYVEFSDGTSWGPDSTNLAERSAGQRAGANIATKRFLKIRSTGNAADVVRAINAGVPFPEPPAGRSDEWKEGFRQGCRSIAAQLKGVEKKGNLSEVDRELLKFAKRFERAK